MADVPSWAWQVLGAAGGLGLGLALGALHLRRSAAQRRQRRPEPSRHPADTGLTSRPPSIPPAPSRFGAQGESPQQRLLEHLRQQNLELTAQVKAAAAQHARLVKAKDDEVAALQDDLEERLEALRQSHATELRHLMALLVEQVDGIHKAHANHVKALEGEIERWRRMRPSRDDGADDVATTTFASTELLPGQPRHH